MREFDYGNGLTYAVSGDNAAAGPPVRWLDRRDLASFHYFTQINLSIPNRDLALQPLSAAKESACSNRSSFGN